MLTPDCFNTYDAFAGLSCFHFTWKPFPLYITAGGVKLPSAQIITMTVIFCQSPSHCWYCGPAFFPPITRSFQPSAGLQPISSVPHVNSSSTSCVVTVSCSNVNQVFAVCSFTACPHFDSNRVDQDILI